jgi:hypothetical protein
MDWNGPLLHEALESNRAKLFFENAFASCRSKAEKIKIVQEGINVSPSTIPSGKIMCNVRTVLLKLVINH